MAVSARIALQMSPEEALRVLIDAADLLDLVAACAESMPGRAQGLGGALVLGLALSACAATLDAAYFDGAYACEIGWAAPDATGKPMEA